MKGSQGEIRLIQGWIEEMHMEGYCTRLIQGEKDLRITTVCYIHSSTKTIVAKQIAQEISFGDFLKSYSDFLTMALGYRLTYPEALHMFL